MIEPKSFFAPKMFEQMSCFTPKMFAFVFLNNPRWYYIPYNTWIVGLQKLALCRPGERFVNHFLLKNHQNKVGKISQPLKLKTRLKTHLVSLFFLPCFWPVLPMVIDCPGKAWPDLVHYTIMDIFAQ